MSISAISSGGGSLPATSGFGPSSPPFSTTPSHAPAHEFDNLMDGFKPAATLANEPSLMSQLVRGPANAYTEGMAAFTAPTPPGLGIVETIELAGQKRNLLSELKTIQSASVLVIRTIRKNVETVLNSK